MREVKETTVDDLIEFLNSVHEDGSVLPAVPDGWTGGDITHRTEDEIHECLVCGNRAHVAYVADSGSGKRWLDLCMPHAHEVRKANEVPASEGFGHAGYREEWKP
jgi:hypothetical protein